ncbi:site-specific DNA-methyltransferase [Mucilaginibacter achroorhodeus]|uniref:site-specific DNA-methyltransferase (adenine-specific) n=1 Tax=Mucilaginibacter achroorhodeus TaxID=2599294 RepID=A0A563U2H9_9SPHI|nr:site-specific DNA-methyltransferase [Mucilaginibacter achroorhodeus]TWR25489.1 site-specific DNA-methyltransferase [Mucilaginibacter achroorhodeus]
MGNTTIYENGSMQNLDKEQLIHLIKELQEEKNLNAAFSNISETGSNDAALMWQGRNRFLAENVTPVSIKQVSEKSFPSPEGGVHRIIDGDNLAVMRSLLTEYRGGPKSGFDVVYIDPPYNTGSDTFIYNDNYRFSKSEVARLKKAINRVEKGVSLDDPSKHTKWINHIAPRLWAARKLMKQTGVLIASIDEHELPRLWMLMEEMFGERNRIATLIWERSRKNDARFVSEGHEYMLLWARDKESLDKLIREKGKWREPKPGLEQFSLEFQRLIELHEDNLKEISLGLKSFVKGIDKQNALWTIRQYVGVDEKYKELGPFKEDDPTWPKGVGPHHFDVLHPDTRIKVRTPPKGWRINTPERFIELDQDNRIVWKGTGTPKIKKYLFEGRENDVITSVIQKESRQSVMTLKSILGIDAAIEHPKDHLILKRLFSVVTWNDPNALILDPYAGSGTTGHAVLEMNSEDNGNRRFVLIENGDPTNKKIPRELYTERLTAERLRRVISGGWFDGKEHKSYDAGFTFYEAKKSLSKKILMESTRENLADIILQIVEEDSNRQDCRMDGYQYLIGKTRLGYGIALVWQPGNTNGHQVLTKSIRSEIMKEADLAGVTKPVYIYAVANVSPINDELYRFQQIPDSILARLNLLEEEED